MLLRMQQIRSALDVTRPFIGLMALIFGLLAAWHALGELLPIVKQIWSPKGSAQSMALVGACLALIAGRA